jgi:ferredoxin
MTSSLNSHMGQQRGAHGKKKISNCKNCDGCYAVCAFNVLSDDTPSMNAVGTGNE